MPQIGITSKGIASEAAGKRGRAPTAASRPLGAPRGWQPTHFPNMSETPPDFVRSRPLFGHHTLGRCGPGDRLGQGIKNIVGHQARLAAVHRREIAGQPMDPDTQASSVPR